MKTTKCDRCEYSNDGEFKRPFEILIHNHKSYDLCGCCVEKLNILNSETIIKFLKMEL